jgi:hypothetical protein
MSLEALRLEGLGHVICVCATPHPAVTELYADE